MKVAQPQPADLERADLLKVDASFNGCSELIPDTIAELHFELALWTRGLESFCSVARHAFPNEKDSDPGRNYRSEFHVANAVLLKCGELIETFSRQCVLSGQPMPADIKEIHSVIRPLILSTAAIARSRALNFAEWNAWCEIVADRLSGSEIYTLFDAEFESRGLEFLPPFAAKVLGSIQLNDADRADLQLCLPKLGGILRSLDVVGRMLDGDAPLKPALAIFAFVYEAVNILNSELNERLLSRQDETSEVFAILDAATYTLSIESKKVFSVELASVINIRSASTVFARTESAFALLNDNIRHLLTGFLRLTEPDANAVRIFPEFSEKLEQSIELRKSLSEVMRSVRAAESDTSDAEMAKLRAELETFLETRLAFLFYKDRETFERFCEEILISTGDSDIRPLLHRFSAYTETLFNQVGMRVVLANHPFTPE